MKIAQSQVHLNGRYQRQQLSEAVSQRSVPVLGSESGSPQTTSAQAVVLSRRASEQQALTTHSSVFSQYTNKASEFSNEQLIRNSVETVLEQRMALTNQRSGLMINGVNVRPAQIQIEQVLTTEEREQFVFETLGKVTTADGRDIDFMISLELDRSTITEQQMFYQGEFVLVDPLMINFEGDMIEFSDLSFDFDLNGDGQAELLAQTAQGSGYLVFDQNQNGEIDDGSEMFGPQSGQGFAELAEYDVDGNGWIDENDPIFQQLQIMTFNNNGEAINLSLAEAGVGAFYLGHAEADYQLQTGDDRMIGNLKQSGVALSEDGQALMFQEIHLATQGEPEIILDASDGVSFLLPALPQFELNSDSGLFAGESIEINTSFSFSFALAVSAASLSGSAITSQRPPPQTSPAPTSQTQSRQSVRDWVSQVMFGRDAEVRQSGSQRNQEAVSSSDNAQQAGNPFMDSEVLQQQQIESRVFRLRSMVEELKSIEVEQQKKYQQYAEQTITNYKKVNRLRF